MSKEIHKDFDEKRFYELLASTYTATCLSALSPVSFLHGNPTNPEDRRFVLWDPKRHSNRAREIIRDRIKTGSKDIASLLRLHDYLAFTAGKIEASSSEEDIYGAHKFGEAIRTFREYMGKYYAYSKAKPHKERKGNPTFLEYPSNPGERGHFFLGDEIHPITMAFNLEGTWEGLDEKLLDIGLGLKDWEYSGNLVKPIRFGIGDGFGMYQGSLKECVEKTQELLEIAGMRKIVI